VTWGVVQGAALHVPLSRGRGVVRAEMTSLTRVPWEGRDSAVRLRETVPLAEAKRGDPKEHHRAEAVSTISEDRGRPATEISRYSRATFEKDDEPTEAASGPAHVSLNPNATIDDDGGVDERRSAAEILMEPAAPTDAEVVEYRRLCKKVGAVPARFYERYFTEATFAMCNHGLGDHGAVAIAHVLEDNQHVTTLELAGNGIGPRGMGALGRMLANNSNVERVDLSYNRLRSEGLARAAEHLGSGRCKLQQVDFGANGFLDMDAPEVCTALSGNTDLLVLSFRNNNFGDMAAKHFGTLLSANTTLEELDLSGNNIRTRGAQMLAEGLSTNVRLCKLNLNSNGVGSVGMTALAEALGGNSTLTQLHVAGNNIGDAGAVALAAALSGRKTMAKVDISNNPISTKGMKALFEAVAASGGACELAFDGIVLDEETIKALEEAAKNNPNARFIGNFPTFDGFDDVRAQAMQASDRIANRAHDWTHKKAKAGPAKIQIEDVEGGEAAVGVADEEEASGLPPHLSRSTKGNMWDDVDQGDLKRRGVSRSSMMIDPNELAAFDEDDPQAERMRLWAESHPDVPDPMLALERYVYQNRLRLVDFFFSIDKDRSGAVSWAELEQAVMVLDGLDLSEEQMDELMDRLDGDGDGEIDYEELCTGRRELTEKLRARDPRWTTKHAEESSDESSDDEEGD